MGNPEMGSYMEAESAKMDLKAGLDAMEMAKQQLNENMTMIEEKIADLEKMGSLLSSDAMDQLMQLKKDQKVLQDAWKALSGERDESSMGEDAA